MSSKSSGKLHRFRNGYEGFLQRCGLVFKTWKQRYVVLADGKLCCFEDEKLEKPIGDLSISEETLVYDIPGAEAGKDFTFYVVNKDSPESGWLLSAASAEAKAEWIEAVVDMTHKGFKLIVQPELWRNAFYPSVDICASFRNGEYFVDNGNILKPSVAEEPPAIEFVTEGKDLYSLLMIDFDYPTEDDITIFVQWGVVNIAGSDVASGDVVASYQPVAPQCYSGLHRVFFLLFKQVGHFSAEQTSETVEHFLQRENFQLYVWTKLMGFSDPVGINGFYAGWEEEYCDRIHAQFNYFPPLQYRSAYQQEQELKRQQLELCIKSRADLYTDFRLHDLVPARAFEIDNGVDPIFINVVYERELPALDGCILKAVDVGTSPEVTYLCSPDSVFTLIMTDLDAPTWVRPTQREYVHWVVTNIRGNKVSSGDTVLPYEPCAPPYSTGLHRYVFCLYQHDANRLLSSSEIAAARMYYAERGSRRTFQWAEKIGLIGGDSSIKSPVGLQAFLCEWDDSVDQLHKSWGYMPEPSFWSPAQAEQIDRERHANSVEMSSNKSESNTDNANDSDNGLIDEKIFTDEFFAVTHEDLEGVGTLHTLEEEEDDMHYGQDSNSEGDSVADDEDVLDESDDSPKVYDRNNRKGNNAAYLAERAMHVLEMAQPPPQVITEVIREEIQDTTVEEETSHEETTEEVVQTEVTTLEEKRINGLRDHQKSASNNTSSTNEKEIAQQSSDRARPQSLQRKKSYAAAGFTGQNNGSNLQSAADIFGVSVPKNLSDDESNASGHRKDQHRRELSSSSSKSADSSDLRHLRNSGALSDLEDDEFRYSLPKTTANQIPNTEAADFDLQKRKSLYSMSADSAGQENGNSPISRSRSMYHTRNDSLGSGSSAGRRGGNIQRSPSIAQMRMDGSLAGPGLVRTASERSMGSATKSLGGRKPSIARTAVLDELSTPIGKPHKPTFSTPQHTLQKKMSMAAMEFEITASGTNEVLEELSLFGTPGRQNLNIQASGSSDDSVDDRSARRVKSSGASVSSANSARYSLGQSKPAPPPMPDISTPTSERKDLRRSLSRGLSFRSSGSGKPHLVQEPPSKEVLGSLKTVRYFTTFKEMCEFFEVDTPSIFEGEIMKKKFSQDFMYKDSYLWIDTSTMSLHWAKSEADRGVAVKQKFIVLDRDGKFDTRAKKAVGEMKGVIQGVECTGGTIAVLLESGERLDLKLNGEGYPAKRVHDWVKVIRYFL